MQTPNVDSASEAIIKRFWSKVEKSDGCWIWVGSINKAGYGQLSTYANGRERKLTATRISYLLAYGPFDNALNVLHRCDNPICVRPDHLFLGTLKDNTQDMLAKGRNKVVPRRSGVSPESARTIRHLYWAERRTCRELGEFFGLHYSHIHHIAHRRVGV